MLGGLLLVNAAHPADIDWLGALAVAGMATLLSLLMSVGSNAATKTGPSLVSAERVVPAQPKPKVS